MSSRKMLWTVLLVALMSMKLVSGAEAVTYAQRLGWPAGTRVVLFHVDDAGMSYDSNRGAILALEGGVATSTSVMMPCPWVPQFARYLK
jgi:hypothetical protein